MWQKAKANLLDCPVSIQLYWFDPWASAASNQKIQIFRHKLVCCVHLTELIQGPEGLNCPQLVGGVVFACKHSKPQCECWENSQHRPLALLHWNSLPPAPLAGWALKEEGLSMADLNEYSLSRSTGPDDSFFHINGHSHKYSNLKGGSSSSGGSSS